MADKINIELDEAFITKLYTLTNEVLPPISEIDITALKKQLYNLGVIIENFQKEIDELKSVKPSKREKLANNTNTDKSSPGVSPAPTPATPAVTSNISDTVPTNDSVGIKPNDPNPLGVPMNYNLPCIQFIKPEEIQRFKQQYYDDDGKPVKGKVLVIDDLGIITYQMSVIFKRAGYLPITAKDVYEAVEKYQRSTFDYVVMDLFLPTEREGFILLEELKKVATGRSETPVIAVMSASQRKEHKQTCQKKGVAFYVEKTDDWQRELFSLLVQY